MGLFDTLKKTYSVKTPTDTRKAQSKPANSAAVDNELIQNIEGFIKSGQTITLDELAQELANDFNDNVKRYCVKVQNLRGDYQKKRNNTYYALIDVTIDFNNHHVKFCSEQHIKDKLLVMDKDDFEYRIVPEKLASFPIEPNLFLLTQKGHVGKAYLSLMARKMSESLKDKYTKVFTRI